MDISVDDVPTSLQLKRTCGTCEGCCWTEEDQQWSSLLISAGNIELQAPREAVFNLGADALLVGFNLDSAPRPAVGRPPAGSPWRPPRPAVGPSPSAL